MENNHENSIPTFLCDRCEENVQVYTEGFIFFLIDQLNVAFTVNEKTFISYTGDRLSKTLFAFRKQFGQEKFEELTKRINERGGDIAVSSMEL